MKKEVAEKWVEALRSGKYNQSKGFLHRTLEDNNGFCCLGVLCDISGLGHWDTYGSYEVYRTGSFVADITLPYGVMLWAGMKDASGDREGKKLPLSTLNDNGYSFSRIADIIEKEWETL